MHSREKTSQKKVFHFAARKGGMEFAAHDEHAIYGVERVAEREIGRAAASGTRQNRALIAATSL